MGEDWNRLRERITGLSTEELLRMVTTEYKDYRQEALNFAMGELAARGVRYRSPLTDPLHVSSFDKAAVGSSRDLDDEEEEEDDEPVDEGPPPICKKCGAEARLGFLFSDREITIVFNDDSEERFVQVHACGKCGHVELQVDYDTDVEPGDR